jgi:cytidylate kinase
MEKTMNYVIGRQFGSGGRHVAAAIGRELGICVYDRELIAKAAEESGFSKELFLKSDEKRSLFSLSNFFAPSAGNFQITENYISDNELFKMQSEVIRGIAQKGPAVFVGRCADYVLRDMNRISVFITAPLEDRIKRVCERDGISPEDAESYMAKQDRTRETYYNYFTFGNWGVASNYDLCVDSSRLGIEGTARLIIDFAARMEDSK